MCVCGGVLALQGSFPRSALLGSETLNKLCVRGTCTPKFNSYRLDGLLTENSSCAKWTGTWAEHFYPCMPRNPRVPGQLSLEKHTLPCLTLGSVGQAVGEIIQV